MLWLPTFIETVFLLHESVEFRKQFSTVKPAYNETPSGRLYPLQADYFSYRHFKIGFSSCKIFS